MKWSQGVGDEGWLPGSTKNFSMVCGHEFEIRLLSTVVCVFPATFSCGRRCGVGRKSN